MNRPDDPGRMEAGPSRTAFPEVNEALRLLRSRVGDVLTDRLVGMMLYGSLAHGGFDPETSDIDVLLVTDARLSKMAIGALSEVHAELTERITPWGNRLEGAYVPRSVIRRHESSDETFPCFNEGRFYLGCLESDWILHRYVMRESGVVVAGPRPDTLIDPVSNEDVRRAVVALLHEWWEPMVADARQSGRLRESGYRAYAVLTMCRALYTLHHGVVVSKPDAAAWARRVLDASRGTLVERAVAWRPGTAFDDLDATSDLIRTAIERAGREPGGS